jgi:putative PEP-CTERM system TPR-repeat lipoprotein
MLDFRQGRTDAARDGVQAVLRVAPDYAPAIALAGSIALAQGALEAAETHARKLADRTPNSIEGVRLLAAVHLRRNDAERALQTAKSLLDRGVQDPVLLGIAGEAALRRNDVVAATGYFERASKLDPGNALRRTSLGLAQIAAGRNDLGFGTLESAAEIDANSAQADLALISARMRAKQYDQALAAIDRLEKKQPGKPLAHGLRGSVHLARSDVASARASFEAALRADPTYFPATASLAELDVRAGKPDDARKRLEAAVQKDPRNVQAAIALARLMERTGAKTEDVEALLKRTRGANPDSIEPALALAQLQIRTNRARDAIPTLQQSLNQHPDDRRLLEVLGTAFLRSDEKQQAIDTFEKLVALEPNSTSALIRLGEIKANSGDTTGAMAAFRQAASLDPKAPGPQVAIAALLVKDGKIAEARRIATTMQKELPSSAAGLALEGDLLAAERKWPEAADAYRRAAAVERSPQLVIKRHVALMRAGRSQEASTVLADAIRSAPGDVALQMYAGEVAVSGKQWQAAVGHYEAVIAAAPANAVARNNLAWSLHELGDPKALEHAEEAYRLAPRAPAILDTLAAIVAERGDSKRAVGLLKEATALSPDAPALRLHYARVLAKSGDRPAARENAELLIRKFPDAPETAAARQLLASL